MSRKLCLAYYVIIDTGRGRGRTKRAPSRARARSSRGRRLAADGPGDRGRRPVAPSPQHRLVFKLVRRQDNTPGADEAAQRRSDGPVRARRVLPTRHTTCRAVVGHELHVLVVAEARGRLRLRGSHLVAFVLLGWRNPSQALVRAGQARKSLFRARKSTRPRARAKEPDPLIS